jgi:hypothetical protein
MKLALSQESLITESPTATFDYKNPGQDTRPNVLILGSWVHPNTGNELVAGINLNYLSKLQLTQLQRTLPKIMRGSDLQKRYWIGRRVLPDVFKGSYRTYKSDKIKAVEPGDLPSLASQKQHHDKDYQQNVLDKVREKLQAQRQAQADQQLPTQIPDVDRPQGAPQPKPKIGTLPEPDRTQTAAEPASPGGGVGKDVGNVLQPDDPIGRPQGPIDDLDEPIDDVVRAAEVDPAAYDPALDVTGLGDVDPLEVEPPVPEPEVDEFEEPLPPLDDSEQQEGFSYGVSGVLWDDPSSYRWWHRPSVVFETLPGTRKTVLDVGSGPTVSGVYDVRTGEVIIDSVHDHIEIMSEAAVGYRHAILIEFGDGFVSAKFEDASLSDLADEVCHSPEVMRLAQYLSSGHRSRA